MIHVSSFRLSPNRLSFAKTALHDTVLAPVFDDVCDMTGVTLTRYMVEVVLANPQLREMESLIMAIQTGTTKED